MTEDQRTRNKLAQRKWRQNNPEKIAAKYAKAKADGSLKVKQKKDSLRAQKQRQNPEGWLRYALIAAKTRAKKKGWDFNVLASDVKPTTHCPVFGTKLNYAFVRDKGVSQYNCPQAPSLDRVDPKKGYIPGNVRIISQRANALKSNGSIEEFQKIIQYMETQNDASPDTCEPSQYCDEPEGRR